MSTRAYLFLNGALAVTAVCGIGLLTPVSAVELGNGKIEIELNKPNADGTRFDDPFATEDYREFFNAARCACNTEFQIELTLRQVTTVVDQVPVEVYVGSNCDQAVDPDRQSVDCELVAEFPDINSLRTTTAVEVPARRLMFPNGACQKRNGIDRNVYVLVDDNGDKNYENVFKLGETLTVDTLPLIEPRDAKAVGIEDGVLATWNLPESTADIEGWQLLCEPLDALPGPDAGAGKTPPKPGYERAAELCPGTSGAAMRRVRAGRSSAGADADAGPTADAGPDADAGPRADAGAGSPDAGAGAGGEIEESELDPALICSPPGGTTIGRLQASGLANRIDYRVILVGFDRSKNPVGFNLGVATPTAVRDFWELYGDEGGSADGGYCFVATAAYGDYDHPYVRVLRDFRDESLASTGLGRWLIERYYDTSPPLAGFIAEHPAARLLARALLFPLVLLAGWWVYGGLAAKLGLLVALALAYSLRRVRRSREPAHRGAEQPARLATRSAVRAVAAAAAAVALLVLWQGVASAQPYWDEPGGPEEQLGGAGRTTDASWTFEIKLGPYTPDIDSEFDGPGPYEQTFGGAKLMTQLELDRYFLKRWGQLGVGAGFGLMRTSATAFEQDANGKPVRDENNDPKRAGDGNDTSLTIVPTWLVAVYRLTELDNRFRIPVIPYAKLGLSYYFWRSTKPSGDVSERPQSGCSGEDCDTAKARGGTLGWQGSIGAAVRVERIDARAAQSLENELGVQHIGLFAELTMARVNGLGMDNKLRVGDTTWLGGLNFEF